ncbi:MAG TPA: nucleoside diphosphate kinase regulator [Anaeromyxobacteraceae bacterium]|nr:nucleoside diphosphate kinase regulator [Anaeromyxobacteraceae bacterium]
MFQVHTHRRPAVDRSAIYVTEHDLERLRRVVAAHESGRDAAAAQQLETELDRALVVPQGELPPDVVTMNSRVVFEDETGRRRDIQLVYPREAAPERGRISILAPVGVALLGLAIGQEIDWPMPNGRTASLRIVSVLYQPEAAGDLHV